MNFKFIVHKSHLLIICGVVLTVFGNTLLNGFVWDDIPMFLSDPVVLEFRLKEMLFSLAGGFEYTPLVSLFLASEYAVWGANPLGFHSGNLVLYLATTLLVYRLSQKLLQIVLKSTQEPERIRRTALATALMFAVHPLHTEVAAWVSANNILLSGIFFLLSCSFYIDWLPGNRKISDRSYIVSLLFFFLTASTKATGIILPLLLLLFLVFYDEKRTLVNYLHLVPFFLVSLLFYLIHKTVAVVGGRINDSEPAFGAANIVSRLISKATVAVQIPFFYLKKFFLPFGLNNSYSDDFYGSLLSFPVIASIVGVFAIAFFAFATRKKHPEILFGSGWLLVTIIPALHFFSTSPVVADRYFYLPLFSPVFIIAVLTGKNSRLMLAVCGLLCFFWASTTVRQNSTWKSNETLWSHAVYSSASNIAYIGLSYELIKQGKYAKALNIISEIKDERCRNNTYNYLNGTILKNRGDFIGALEFLEASYLQNKDSLDFLSVLAETFEKAGKIEQAVKIHNEIIQNSKGFGAYSIGKVSSAALVRLTQNPTSQLNVLRNKVELHPDDNKLRNDLAIQLDHLGFYDEALTHYLEQESRGVSGWQFYFNIGNVYKKIGKYDQAVIYYDKSLSQNPDYVDSINNIGIAHEKLGHYDKAIHYYNLAISKEPTFAYAYFNLAVLYFNTGDKDKSKNLFNYTILQFPQLQEKAEPYLQILLKSR